MTARTILVVGDNGQAIPLAAGDTLKDVSGNPISIGSSSQSALKARVLQNSAISLNAAPLFCDDVELQDGDAVLYNAHPDATLNGLYTVTSAGSGSDGVWERHPSMDSNTELNSLVEISIRTGTRYGKSQWILDASAGLVIDVSELIFINSRVLNVRDTYEADFFLDGVNQLTNAQVCSFVAPRPGYLIAAGISVKSARISGTISVKLTIDGVPIGDTELDLVINNTFPDKAYKITNYAQTSAFYVGEGQTVGAQVTTSSFAPLLNKASLVIQVEAE